jgi:hypothetical protein
MKLFVTRITDEDGEPAYVVFADTPFATNVPLRDEGGKLRLGRYRVCPSQATIEANGYTVIAGVDIEDKEASEKDKEL